MIEPVAHRFKWEEKMSWQYGDGYDATGAPNDPDYFTYEPLYTHPMRELSDEEIKQIFRDESGFEIDACPIAILDFARAILRKAQEK